MFSYGEYDSQFVKTDIKRNISNSLPDFLSGETGKQIFLIQIMRIVVQRVLEAAVSVGGQEISRTGRGMLILLGITPGDNSEVITRYAQKMLKLRIWDEIPKSKETSSKPEDDTPTSTTSTSSTQS